MARVSNICDSGDLLHFSGSKYTKVIVLLLRGSRCYRYDSREAGNLFDTGEAGAASGSKRESAQSGFPFIEFFRIDCRLYFSLVPQFVQNLFSGGIAAPQVGQIWTDGATGGTYFCSCVSDGMS